MRFHVDTIIPLVEQKGKNTNYKAILKHLMLQDI